MNSLAGAVVLTKTGGILGPIAGILGWIMDLLFRFTSTFGIENIGLCIILFTLVTKLLMMPLTIKQQKSSKLMAVMQPEINAIQKKYKGKENDQKSAMMMQAEMKAVYEKYGTSMTGGCLPLAIQMPIIFALYRVIYNIPAYVQSVRGYYETVISQLPAGYQTQDVFTQLAQACRMTGDKFDFTNVNTVIDLLYKFTAQQWQTFIGAFPAAGEAAVEGGVNAVQAIEKMLVKERDQYDGATLGSMSFGQALSVSPIEIARAVGGIANGGVMMTPHFYKSSKGDEKDWGEGERAISEDAASQVTSCMQTVVSEGMGVGGAVDGYDVAGKTGTAERADENGGYLKENYMSSFMGFAPAQSPKVLCYITLDGTPSGSDAAAVPFQSIMANALDVLGIPHTK